MTATLHLGDCVEFMRTLADKSVDHVIADPPYSEHVHGNARTNDKRAADKVHDIAFRPITEEDMRAYAVEYARICTRWIVLFGAEEDVPLWRKTLEAVGLEYVRTMAWIRHGAPQMTGDRPGQGFETICLAHRPGKKKWNGGGKDGVYYANIPRGDDRHGHPTPKPLDLMRQLVADFTDFGEVILDSHMGSGTTGEAALTLGRQFIGCELSAKHYETARKRLDAVQRQETLFTATPKATQMGLL